MTGKMVKIILTCKNATGKSRGERVKDFRRESKELNESGIREVSNQV